MSKNKPFHSARWPEVSPLLDDLLDLPAAERPAWLAKLRERDAELASELQALLAGNDQTGTARVLDGAAALASGDEGLAGRTIGAYLLESPLGQGGSGSVWRAKRQDGRYDGAVAIKLLHMHMLGRAAATRFQREGQILAQLQHPHIAQMLDAGVTSDGQPYLVLELVEGEPIDRYCKSRRLGLDERLALFNDVLGAVANAHAHGVIHRDLKPGNILVNGEGQVKLLDFGIAKLHDDQAGASEATELTRDEGGPMTPAYAAPEQLLGQPLTTATDVYSLGVLLYQLLSGRHPADTTGSTDAHALARATLEREAPRLSRAVETGFSGWPEETTPQSLKRLQHRLAGDLETIVGHALAKKPAERYPGVTALAEDLRRWKDHEPISAQAPSFAYRARKFIRRNRGAVTAGSLTTLAIVAGLIGTVSQARRAEQQAAIAEQQAALAQEEARNATFSGKKSEAALTVLMASLGTAATTPQTMAQLLESAEASASQQVADDPATLGYVELVLASLWYNVGQVPRVQALAERAEAHSRQGGSTSNAASAACFNASALLHLRKDAEAIVKLDAALADAKSLSPFENLSLLGCYDMRSGLAAEAGEFDRMSAVIEAALGQIKAWGKVNTETLMLGNALRTRLLRHQDKLADAVRSYDDTLAGLKKLGQDEHSIRSAFFSNFGQLLQVAGQAERAETMLRSRIDLATAAGGESKDAQILYEHGSALLAQGRSVDALAQYQQARAIDVALGVKQAGNADRLAAAYCTLGQVAACEAEVKLLADQPGLAPVLARAQLQLSQGHAQDARATLQAVLAQLRNPVAPHFRQARREQGLLLISAAELQSGDAKAALASAQEALGFARSDIEGLAASIWTGQALLAKADAQQSLGDKAAAQASRRDAVTQFEGAAGKTAPVTERARQLLTEK